MKILGISDYTRYRTPIFKGGGNKKTQKAQNEKFNVKLPDASHYDYSPLYTDIEEGSRLREEYREKLISACFDKEGKLHPLIKDKLDNSLFAFQLDGNTVKVMSIKDAVKSSVMSERSIDTDVIHATSGIENAKSIVKNGFDPKRISRTEFGPGFYFATSEGNAMNYGSAKVQARLKGKCAIMNGKYYENIKTDAVVNAVKEYTGMKSMGYPTYEIEDRVAEIVVDEYTRNLLVNELGYDCAYGSNGCMACYVAYNPDAIHDVEIC